MLQPASCVNLRVYRPLLNLLPSDDPALFHVLTKFSHRMAKQEPHTMESACPTTKDGSVSPCLADGALEVVIDGQEGMLPAPGKVVLAPDVTVEAVNLPGACRSFGFEKVRCVSTAETSQTTLLL